MLLGGGQRVARARLRPSRLRRHDAAGRARRHPGGARIPDDPELLLPQPPDDETAMRRTRDLRHVRGRLRRGAEPWPVALGRVEAYFARARIQWTAGRLRGRRAPRPTRPRLRLRHWRKRTGAARPSRRIRRQSASTSRQRASTWRAATMRASPGFRHDRRLVPTGAMRSRLLQRRLPPHRPGPARRRARLTSVVRCARAATSRSGRTTPGIPRRDS